MDPRADLARRRSGTGAVPRRIGPGLLRARGRATGAAGGVPRVGRRTDRAPRGRGRAPSGPVRHRRARGDDVAGARRRRASRGRAAGRPRVPRWSCAIARGGVGGRRVGRSRRDRVRVGAARRSSATATGSNGPRSSDDAAWVAKLALHETCTVGPDGHDAPAHQWVAMERTRCATGEMSMWLFRHDGARRGDRRFADGRRASAATRTSSSTPTIDGRTSGSVCWRTSTPWRDPRAGSWERLPWRAGRGRPSTGRPGCNRSPCSESGVETCEFGAGSTTIELGGTPCSPACSAATRSPSCGPSASGSGRSRRPRSRQPAHPRGRIRPPSPRPHRPRHRPVARGRRARCRSAARGAALRPPLAGLWSS